jgi:hypothetical protein
MALVIGEIANSQQQSRKEVRAVVYLNDGNFKSKGHSSRADRDDPQNTEWSLNSLPRACPASSFRNRWRRGARATDSKVRGTDDSADMRVGDVLENCIFYIFPMYEFLHSLGQRAKTSP